MKLELKECNGCHSIMIDGLNGEDMSDNELKQKTHEIVDLVSRKDNMRLLRGYILDMGDGNSENYDGVYSCSLVI